MKKLLCICAIFASLFLTYSPASAQGVLSKIKQKTKDKTNQRVDDKIDKTIDKTLDEAENATKSDGSNDDKSKEKEKVKVEDKDKTAKNDASYASKVEPASPAVKVYQNYDFVPGDKILFEDQFTDDQNGEFASHWKLANGQAVLNKLGDQLAMHMTDGNYARLTPRMKTDKYLSDPFTVEYDYYHIPGSYGVILLLKFMDKKEGFERESSIGVNGNNASFTGTSSGVDLNKDFPQDLLANFDNKWHHIAIAIKNHQLKIYVDQYRTLVVPDIGEDYQSITFASIGSETTPAVFKNVRIASGGGMNMLGKKFTDAKIVTHGINFDIDKATIKPESMGTLNMIVQVMKENPEIKFEVDGHTDNSGTAAHNLTLSQQRAVAVREQLIQLGVDGTRLTTKGFGDTKPISDNTTLEGKANNRRVEFVKM